MLLRMLFQLIILTSSIAIANNEQKTVLPASVLKAHNVVVLVDPEAGISVTDPVANKKAQDDIEKAILKWGRFKPVSDVETADLVIVIRKGSGKTVQSTIGGLPTNDRPVPSIPIGGQKGHPPNVPQQEEDTRPHPQVEVGQSQDMFVVYEGHVTRPLERPPVWRYIAKNALHSPDVPAVGEFRKLIEGVEKQRNDKP